MRAAIARPVPVLPDVGSMIVPPGRSRPSASAASTIRIATRSLIEPPGLKYSTLATTCGVSPAAMRDRRTSGVSPTVSRMESLMSAGAATRPTLQGRAGDPDLPVGHRRDPPEAGAEALWLVRVAVERRRADEHPGGVARLVEERDRDAQPGGHERAPVVAGLHVPAALERGETTGAPDRDVEVLPLARAPGDRVEVAV